MSSQHLPRRNWAHWALLAAVLIAPLAAESVSGDTSRDAFFRSVGDLCGAVFEGTMSFPEDPEHAFAGKPLEATVASCSDTEIRVPFAVGEDRSRTWILTRSEGGLAFEHDHRHEDGTPDEITMYGGWAASGGSSLSQAFPANDHTRALIPEAATNVWHLTLSADGSSLTYFLERHSEPRFEATLTRASSPSE